MDYLKKIFYLIPYNFINKIVFLFFLLVASVFFELLGIGLILPTISVVAEGNFLFFEKELNYLANYFGTTSTYLILSLLVLVFFIKTIFYLLFHWYQFTFAASMNTAIASKLFNKYIYADYDFYLKRNSSTLMRNVHGEANQFVKKLLVPLIHLVLDSLILVGILSILMFIEFQSVFIIISIYIFFGFIFYLSIKSKLKKIGEGHLFNSQKIILYAQSAFQGIKSIKIFLKEDPFLRKFTLFTKNNLMLSRTQSFLMSIPKHFFELLTVILFSIIIIHFVGSSSSNSFIEILPKLTLFAAAAIKLVPSVNKIIVNIQIMRAGSPSLNNLYNEFKNLDKINIIDTKFSEFSFQDYIKFEDLSFSYEGTSNKVFEKVNIKIPKNSCIGIIGKTGVGKSTFLDLILGLIGPQNGKVLVDQKNIQENLRGWQNIVGYVPQDVFILDDTLKNNIALNFDNKVNDKFLEHAMEISQIDEFLDISKSRLDSIVGEKGVRLSGGQRQRIGIARALYKNPELIILDEATSSLDVNTESKIISDLNKIKGKKTIIIVSHRISALDICDHVYEIKEQKLFKK